jgi:hypothetical protein
MAITSHIRIAHMKKMCVIVMGLYVSDITTVGRIGSW